VTRGSVALGVAVAFAACSRESARSGPPPSLLFAWRGQDVPSLTLAEMRKLGDERVVVSDPHEHRSIELCGVPVARVFDAAFGPAWRGAEEVVATCSDGFRPAIPVKLFLEREAFFAYARTDTSDFAVQEGSSKRTNVGPYYLVWKARGGDDPPEPQWPYQVTAVEVTDYAARFEATLPPAEGDPRVLQGFERFRTACLPCHAINGRGGVVGPELNYPVNVTEYFAGPVLRKWIEDPAQVRHGAKMPRPLPPGEESERAIDEIVAYLGAMARRKMRPPGP